MSKLLTLLGSGEFTDAIKPVDEILISHSLKTFNIDRSQLKVAIIPTAAGQEPDYHKWIDDGINHFSKLGVAGIGIDIIDKQRANDEKLLARLDTANIIYLSGGDPGYLFETLKDSKGWNKILHKYNAGTILVGSSAGAMVFGNQFLSNPYQCMFSDIAPIWKTGFNLLPYAIIPHYDYVLTSQKPDFERILENTPLEIKNNLLGIEENTAVIIDNLAATTGSGNVFLFKDATKQMYKPGETIQI